MRSVLIFWRILGERYMKICHQCGEQNPDKAKFCGVCGSLFTEQQKKDDSNQIRQIMEQPTMNQSQVTPVYDNRSQYDRVVRYVIPGEKLQAVYDCKGTATGFVGFTDQRLIFYDQEVLSGHKSMISIPYHQIVGVATADEGLFFKTGQITIITSAGKFNFEFRGTDKAVWAYSYIMSQILSWANRRS